MTPHGWFTTLIGTALHQIFLLSNMRAEDVALTKLHLATADQSKLVNGVYYHPIGRFIGDASRPQGDNETLQKFLWSETDKIILEAGF
jgi:hypothetical protein